jgi:hypothetical protein
VSGFQYSDPAQPITLEARPFGSSIGGTAQRSGIASLADERWFLMALLLAAAMPLRIVHGLPIVDSFSILDVVLLVAGLTLFLDLSFRPLDTGYQQVFVILCVPLVVSMFSIVWSQDRPATVRAILIYVEGVIAYLFVVRELGRVPSAQIVRYLERFAYLLIIPGVLLLLHVPGFEPRLGNDVSHTSGQYLTYFTRFSHPVLGPSNNLATVLACLVPILLYWGHEHHDRHATIAGFVASLAILLTFSRGILLAFLVTGVAFAILTSGGRRLSSGVRVGRKVVGGVVLGVLAIAAFYFVNPTTHELFKTRFSLTNVFSREALLSDAVAKIASRPVLGYGAGVAPDHDPRIGEGVHNTYVQQAIYFGLPLGVLVSAALLGLAGFFLARRASNAVSGVVAFTVIVLLVSFLFESSFEGTVLRMLFYMSIGLAVALLRSIEAEHPPGRA